MRPVQAIGVGLLAAAPVLGEAQAAGPVRLLSHQAQYVMALDRSEQRSDIVAADGLMVMEWEDNCDGYTINQRFTLGIGDSLGQQMINDFIASSWEARDGSFYEFNVVQRINGTIAERYRGQVEVTSEDAPPVARYREPEQREIELPVGTIFPTAHLLALLNAARAGEQLLEQVVFDGTGDDPLYEIIAFIGRRMGADAPPPAAIDAEARRLIQDLPSWTVQVGYYPLRQSAGEPEFQITARLFDNGVASDLTLDYGDMVLSGALKDIEAISAPSC